jgi:hypothetical protein
MRVALGRRPRPQVGLPLRGLPLRHEPTHTCSIAASLLLPASALHFFDRIGYTHAPFTHCPRSAAARAALGCDCAPRESADAHWFSCTPRWLKVQKLAGAWDEQVQGAWRDGPEKWAPDAGWERPPVDVETGRDEVGGRE